MQHNSENKLKFWYADLLALAAFTMPLSKKLTVPILALVLILAITSNGFRADFVQKIKSPFVWLCLLFFGAQVMGFFYSDNSKSALFDLQTKLSFLLIPIFIRTDLIGYEYLEKIKKAFIQGCVLGVLLSLAASIYRFYLTREMDSFFYGNFSSHIHTSYFSSYLTFALSFILFSKKMRSKSIWWIAAGLMLFGIILCLSRAGIITAFVVFSFFIWELYSTIENKKVLKVIVGSLFLIVLTSLLLPKVRERIRNAFVLNEQKDESVQASTAYERIEVWKVSFYLIRQNPLLGFGPGDVKEELVREYKNRNMLFAAKYTLNAHNQYLQTSLANGILGLLILVALLLGGIFNAIKTGNRFLFVLLIISVIGFMFESMLETQAGIVFFVFFYLLFILHDYNYKSINGNRN
jgi:O-antigen ligase